jgi:acylphosphatase
MRRVRAIVSGRVQGVSYRVSTAKAARARGLTGWVRNLPDGDVELEVQGEAAQVEALLDWCKQGPPAALVTRLAIDPREVIADETEFWVR